MKNMPGLLSSGKRKRGRKPNSTIIKDMTINAVKFQSKQFREIQDEKFVKDNIGEDRRKLAQKHNCSDKTIRREQEKFLKTIKEINLPFKAEDRLIIEGVGAGIAARLKNKDKTEISQRRKEAMDYATKNKITIR